jgi:hypothetical protein
MGEWSFHSKVGGRIAPPAALAPSPFSVHLHRSQGILWTSLATQLRENRRGDTTRYFEDTNPRMVASLFEKERLGARGQKKGNRHSSHAGPAGERDATKQRREARHDSGKCMLFVT